MDAIKIQDSVLIGSYEDVKDLPLSTITNDTDDTSKLDGLVIRGYETKFGSTNTNGERYDKECIDEFIEEYFVKNKLNMPVTLLHRVDIDHLCGKVLIVESNSVGFYFVVYVPRTYAKFDAVKSLIKEGIIQGFSKEGWTEDYEFCYKKDGSFDYMRIKKMNICNVSLVASPANAVKFEKTQEIKNATKFVKNKPNTEDKKSAYKKMFV